MTKEHTIYSLSCVYVEFEKGCWVIFVLFLLIAMSYITSSNCQIYTTTGLSLYVEKDDYKMKFLQIQVTSIQVRNVSRCQRP